ncbi:MAG: TRAP transporter large permease [Pseudomonadota bacterium]|nr:TRAP transporter large permease [Pseudomonadota bacterium]
MSVELVGVLGILCLFILMVLRTPVAFAMLIVGFLGYWFLEGQRSASALLLTETFSTVSNYSLVVVPMFILMGNISSAAGFSAGLYEAANAWIGRFRGGLASASVLGCAVFSAVSGSSVATAVTLGKVALPEMRRFGYADRLATGSIAAGGTLGFLIPPSTGFVIYAILTEQSIGRLFMAGILPGLVLTLLFIAVIWLVSWFDPAAGPRGARVSVRERFRVLAKAGPILLVIVVSIGGIYVGVFTPVEASGIGAALILIMSVLMRRLDFAAFRFAVLDTLKTTAMLYAVVVGASVLNPFFAVTHIPATLGAQLEALGVGAYGTLVLIILMFLILGMFMDGLSMLVITMPIFFPIITGFGFDPIWFGVIAVIAIEMGMITPPVGLNVFVVRGVADGVALTTIFRGVAPFLAAMAVALVLITLVPEIALFIPNTMFD